MPAAAPPLPKLIGEHTRSLDSALRVSLPKEWRSPQIKEYYLFAGSAAPCVRVMSVAEYDRKVAEIVANDSLEPDERTAVLRVFGSQCHHVELDKAERISVPQVLCKRLGVSADKPEVLFVGAVHAIEIWHPATFKSWMADAWNAAQPKPKAKSMRKLNFGKIIGL